MHLLICAALYYPFKGGYVESIHQLCKNLQRKGIKITIVTCNTHNSAPYEIIDNIPVYRIPCWNPKFLNNSYPIPKLLSIFKFFHRFKKNKIDIISTQTRFFITSILFFLFAKYKKIPCLHVERGGSHTKSEKKHISLIGKLIDHTGGWLICKFSNKTIGVSKAATSFTKHLGAKKPLTIHNGVDIESWKIQNRIESDYFNIVFFGRIIFAKGIQDLLKAISKLDQNSLKKIRLKIIGEGPYLTTLQKQAQTLKINHLVDFLGEKKSDEIKKNCSYNNAFFVNPSHSEGLPRSVLEAGAMGLPIIATNVGGTKEIITSDEYGFLVTPNNVAELSQKIDILINNKNLRNKMGENIKQLIHKNFNWKTITEKYLSVLNELNAK